MSGGKPLTFSSEVMCSPSSPVPVMLPEDFPLSPIIFFIFVHILRTYFVCKAKTAIVFIFQHKIIHSIYAFNVKKSFTEKANVNYTKMLPDKIPEIHKAK